MWLGYGAQDISDAVARRLYPSGAGEQLGPRARLHAAYCPVSVNINGSLWFELGSSVRKTDGLLITLFEVDVLASNQTELIIK